MKVKASSLSVLIAFVWLNAMPDILAQTTDPQAAQRSKMLEERARDLFNKQHYEAAIDYCNKAIREDRRNTGALVLRSESYFRNAEFDKGLRDATFAIKLDPKNARAYLARAKIYAVKDDFAGAEKDYAAALRIQPDYRNAYQSRGSFYLENNKPEKAVIDFTRSIELEPGATDGYKFRSMAYRELKKHDLAAADMTKQIEVTKTGNGQLYLSRASEYLAMKDNKRALADLDMAVKNADPKYKYIARTTRARLLCKFGQHEKALADYQVMLNSNPDDYEALVFVGTENTHLNKYPAALKAFSQSIQLAPDYAEAFRRRAEAYRKMGKLDLARKDLQTVKKLQNSSN